MSKPDRTLLPSDQRKDAAPRSAYCPTASSPSPAESFGPGQRPLLIQATQQPH
jgi:hypothetical protein